MQKGMSTPAPITIEKKFNNGDTQIKIQTNLPPPGNIRQNFRPLATIGMIFGLFPGYDLSFKENLTSRGLKIIHILHYTHTAILILLMTAGAVVCIWYPPNNLEAMLDQDAEIDLIVLCVGFYMLLVMGILSPFVFLRQSKAVLAYIDHFANVDKILCFTPECEKKERCFARKMLVRIIVVCFSSGAIFVGLFIVFKPEIEKSWTDYLMPFIGTLAVMTHVIPSVIFVFFLNGIRARLALFNEKMRILILPITPSCSNCDDYADFGKELDVCPRLSSTLTEDLDKMRILHEEISSLTDETSDVFGFHIIREFLYSFVSVICYTYFLFFMITDFMEELKYVLIYLFLDIFMLLKLHFISTFPHLISTESSSSLKLLNKACFQRLSPESTIQIEAFIKKLEKPNVITASGFFNVNRSTISCMLGSMTTFFIILIQFRTSDLTNELQSLPDGNTCWADGNPLR